MQHHSADQLHIEVPHVEDAFPGFPHDGKCFREDAVQRLLFPEALLEFGCF